jgi:hypothetical protein
MLFLFVNQYNLVAIVKYKGLRFEYSNDHVYSVYHDSEDKEKDNKEFLCMTKSYTGPIDTTGSTGPTGLLKSRTNC